jgi:aminotransferase/cystathionine beta-lyase
MKHLFDQVIDRTHSDSIRWDKYGPDVIPLWVADMDFQSPECVVQALHKRIDHGVYGYTYASQSLKESIQEYVNRRYGWRIETAWIHFLPSVVTALHLSVRMLTQPGDHVLIPGPAYHHFQDAVIGAGRDYSIYDIRLQEGRATFSTAQLESLVKPNTRLLMLCNPHNPGGTVFTKEELSTLAQFAKEHQIIICSDEIHADLILDEGLQHIPMGSIGEGIEEQSFSLMSLNKTFNYPGLGLAWVICPNLQLSQQLLKDLHSLIPNPNLLSYVATQAAIEHGQEWHQALIQYLRTNRDYVQRRIDTITGLSMHHLQATYLAWIDASHLHWDNPYEHFLKAGVALSPGSQFGDNQFVRFNFGTQRTLLEKALDRIELACHP